MSGQNFQVTKTSPHTRPIGLLQTFLQLGHLFGRWKWWPGICRERERESCVYITYTFDINIYILYIYCNLYTHMWKIFGKSFLCSLPISFPQLPSLQKKMLRSSDAQSAIVIVVHGHEKLLQVAGTSNDTNFMSHPKKTRGPLRIP